MQNNMATLGRAVRSGLEHSVRIAEARAMGMDLDVVAVVVEALLGDVGAQCSRVVVVEGGGVEALVDGGDYAAFEMSVSKGFLK